MKKFCSCNWLYLVESDPIHVHILVLKAHMCKSILKMSHIEKLKNLIWIYRVGLFSQLPIDFGMKLQPPLKIKIKSIGK